MRKIIPLIISSVAAWSFSQASLSADGPLVGPGAGGDPGGADAGARPHLDHKPERGDPVKPNKSRLPNPDLDKARPGDTPGDASSGSSAAPGGTSGKDMDAIETDEDKAKANKDKFRGRPGYKEDPAQPRASGPAGSARLVN
jgi:hypothetical protein